MITTRRSSLPARHSLLRSYVFRGLLMGRKIIGRMCLRCCFRAARNVLVHALWTSNFSRKLAAFDSVESRQSSNTGDQTATVRMPLHIDTTVLFDVRFPYWAPGCEEYLVLRKLVGRAYPRPLYSSHRCVLWGPARSGEYLTRWLVVEQKRHLRGCGFWEENPLMVWRDRSLLLRLGRIGRDNRIVRQRCLANQVHAMGL